METITTQAVYRKGVLKPKKKLDLPEETLVEVQIKKISGHKENPFASLIGIWQDLSDSDVAGLERNLEKARRQSGKKIAQFLKQ